MISNSSTQSIGKSSSNSSISNPDPQSAAYHAHAKTESHSSLETSTESWGFSINYGKKCYICDKNFIFRKKNLCKMCNNYVCSDHFNKIRAQEKVCDFCDKKEAKLEVRKEIEKELRILSGELEKSRQNCNKIDREYYSITSELNKIDQEFIRLVDYHDGKKMLINARIGNEKERTLQNSLELENYKKNLEESEHAQQEMQVKLSVVQVDLERITSDLLELKEKNASLSQDLEKKCLGLSGKANLLELQSKFCRKCSKKF